MTSFVTGWSEYFASFSMALVTLKVVDATLIKVETILKTAEYDTAKTVSSYVKTIHIRTIHITVERRRARMWPTLCSPTSTSGNVKSTSGG